MNGQKTTLGGPQEGGQKGMRVDGPRTRPLFPRLKVNFEFSDCSGRYLTMNGQSKIILLALVGVVLSGVSSTSSKKSCPDLNRPKWTRGATNALMNLINNQHKISLKRCLPEVTDFSCARLSR